ncbi:MAG: lipopolysaccharide heptosyltransferase II [Candidatus Cloacimonas sp. 4484_140]|nr:MAG: lipopolysaccharide heptosyltransferase II [Candidatus Cloacimonas sp. 4484_140]
MKVLFIRFSSLGDVLLTTPIIRTFCTHFQNAEIHFLTKKQFAPLLEYNPFIDTLISFDSENESMLQLIIRLQKEHYTHIIDLHDKLRSALIKRFVRGKVFTYKKKHNYRKKLLKDHELKPISSTVDLYASVLEKFALSLDEKKLDFFLPENEEAIAASFLSSDKKIIVTISPGTSWHTKQYPTEYYKKLIRNLLDNHDVKIVLLGTEQEKNLTTELAAVSETKILNLCGRISLIESAVIIKHSDLFISGDCGPMHIAAAFEVPQIAIFGPTHPKLGFAPLNPNAKVLTLDLDCSPCTLHGNKQCPKSHFKCMMNLSPDMVISELSL